MTAVRTLSPDIIFCDELGSESEANEVLNGIACGVKFIVTAHASSLNELYLRHGTKKLLESGLIDAAVFLDTGKNIGKIKEIFYFGAEDYENCGPCDDICGTEPCGDKQGDDNNGERQEAYSVISMLKYIRTLISYVSTPADKILDSLLESEYKDMFFIKDARERFRRGDSFSSAWKNAIDKNKSDTCLPQDCIEKLKAFSDTFGSADKQSELENCDTFISYFELRQKELHERAASAPRVYGSLGVLFGALAVIVLF